VVGARLHRHVERRAARALACGIQRDDLAVRTALALVPTLGDDLAVAHDDRADDGIRMCRAAPSLGELKRAFEAHASSCSNRRYARDRSSPPKTEVPATNSDAPASRTARMFSGPMPPSTCTGTSGGSSERAVRMRSYASGMNFCPE